MSLDEVPADREAEARAFRRRTLAEPIEDLVEILRGDANTGIRHGEVEVSAIALCTNGERATIGHRSQCVDDEVGQHLTDSHRVEHDLPDARADVRGHGHAGGAGRAPMALEHIVDQVRQITASAGADVVYDSVAGPGFARSFEMCRAGGTVVLFGRAAGDPPREVLEDAFLRGARNLGLRTYSLASILFSDPRSIRGAYATLFDGLASGTIFLPIETLPLEKAADAHALIEGQQTVGKIVLLPPTS